MGLVMRAALAILICSSFKEQISPQLARADLQGSFANACITARFYVNLDSMIAKCATSLPLDSFDVADWVGGCPIQDIMLTDTSLADIKFKNGLYEMQAVNPEVEVSDTELTLNGEVVTGLEYPFLNPKKMETPIGTFSIVVVNRYIGGCYHNEYLWEVVFNE